MARRRLLGDDVWARHMKAPADEREVARYFTLGPDELAGVMNKRSDANRLGYAQSLRIVPFELLAGYGVEPLHGDDVGLGDIEVLLSGGRLAPALEVLRRGETPRPLAGSSTKGPRRRRV